MKKKILAICLSFIFCAIGFVGLSACHSHNDVVQITYKVENNKAIEVQKCSCGKVKETELEAGTYVIATPENAQLILDGFASEEASNKVWNDRTSADLAPISNKTVVFSDGNYGNLFLRAGANPTVYESETSDTPLTTETQLINNSYTYVRKIENTKFVGTNGAVFTGIFNATNAKIDLWYSIYDTVRNVDYSQEGYKSYTCNQAIILDNVTFENLTFNGVIGRIYLLTDKVFKNAYANNIKINNCKFLENEQRPIVESEMTKEDKSHPVFRKNLAAIMLESFDSTFFKNVSVTNCEITQYWLGIKMQGINNATIKNNRLNNIQHNPIQLTGTSKKSSTPVDNVFATGNLIVEKNVIDDTRNQSFKFYYLKDATVTLKDNVATRCGWVYSDQVTYHKEVTNKAGTTVFKDINNKFNGTKIKNTTRTLEGPIMVDFEFKNGEFQYEDSTFND